MRPGLDVGLRAFRVMCRRADKHSGGAREPDKIEGGAKQLDKRFMVVVLWLLKVVAVEGR